MAASKALTPKIPVTLSTDRPRGCPCLVIITSRIPTSSSSSKVEDGPLVEDNSSNSSKVEDGALVEDNSNSSNRVEEDGGGDGGGEEAGSCEERARWVWIWQMRYNRFK